MNEETIEYVMLKQIDEIKEVFKYSIAIEDDFVKNKLEKVMCNLWLIQTKSQKIRRFLKDALDGLKSAKEDEGYDTNNEQYDIKSALDLLK